MSDKEEKQAAMDFEVIEDSEETAVAINERRAIAQPMETTMSGFDRLVELAVTKDFDPDKMRQVFDMVNAQKDREAKETFEREFAAMQAEFIPATKSKQGYEFKYAPLEILQKHFGPIIAAHGFSQTWDEIMLDNGWKRVIMTISGHGHSRDTKFDVPPMEATKRQNAVQVMGGMSTYGMRYTYRAGYALPIEAEDADDMGGKLDDKIEVAIAKMKHAGDYNELDEIFRDAYKNANANGKKALQQAKQDWMANGGELPI